MLRSLLLDSNNDLNINDSLNIEFVESITQKIKNRLLFIKGEWLLNTTLGLPYFDEMLEKGIDLNFVKQIFEGELLKIDGITEVVELTLDLVVRELTVNFTVLFDDTLTEGSITI